MIETILNVILFLASLSPMFALILARYIDKRNSERMYLGFMGISKKRKTKKRKWGGYIMFRFCCNCMFFDFYISRLFPSTLCSICSADPCVNPHAYDYGCSGHLTKEEFEQRVDGNKREI